jgi:ABC-2 type transport system permease protein
MRTTRHIWFIAAKDLKRFVRDRGALFFFILFPFLFVVVFNFMFTGVGSEDDRLELHVTTQEAEGGLSYEIIGALETKDETHLEPGDPIVVWDKDYEVARQAVEAGDLDGFVVFPADFTEEVMVGSPSRLDVVVGAESYIATAALNGFADAIASRIGSQRVAATAAIELLVENGLISPSDTEAIQEVLDEVLSGEQAAGGGGSTLLEFVTEKVGEVEEENAANYVIPGYLVMFVFFAAALGAPMIVQERQNNTLERLLGASVRRETILGGMFCGTALKGLIQISVFWAVGILAFDIDLGVAPSAVILLSILMAITSAAFAIMLATLVKTERSAGSIAVLASLVLAPLGGCWWPLFIVPVWMQFIAKLTPHGWANDAFNKIMLFGADFNAAVPSMLALVGFAALFGIVAVWRFRTSAA